ncbi:MAG: hypothetical protein AAFQ60_01745, partial [Pseudomonadota bacterium]
AASLAIPAGLMSPGMAAAQGLTRIKKAATACFLNFMVRVSASFAHVMSSLSGHKRRSRGGKQTNDPVTSFVTVSARQPEKQSGGSIREPHLALCAVTTLLQEQTSLKAARLRKLQILRRWPQFAPFFCLNGTFLCAMHIGFGPNIWFQE